MEKLCDNFNLNSNTEVFENTQSDLSPSGENTLENNISSSSDDTQPVKKVEGCHARNTPPGDIKRMELMIADLLTPSISRNTCPLEFHVLYVELMF